MAGNIHIGDIGTLLIVAATYTDQNGVVQPLPVGSALVLHVIISRPDGSVLTKTGSVLNTGSDGKFYYATQTGDINGAGRYQVQGYASINTPFVWAGHTDSAPFTVKGNLD